MSEPMKPMEIEQRSFEIITELLGNRVLDPENELVIKRVIHTTADFDYADNLTFSDHAVRKGIAALKSGCDIVTDTQMAKAGINKTILASLGGEVHCFMSDPDVAQEARSRGVTRAFVSMEKAAALEKPCIFARRSRSAGKSSSLSKRCISEYVRTMFSSLLRNHLSIFVSSWMRSML